MDEPLNNNMVMQNKDENSETAGGCCCLLLIIIIITGIAGYVYLNEMGYNEIVYLVKSLYQKQLDTEISYKMNIFEKIIEIKIKIHIFGTI